jgi:uncharacterized RDD family membrane protein YckC
MEPGEPLRDAGFWRRAAAAVIDNAIVLVLFTGAVLAAFLAFLNSERGLVGRGPGGRDWVPNALMVVLLATHWLYHALAERSARQATLGKRAMGLRVVDLEGRRIGFGRASGRYFAKLLSTLPLLGGFAMAGLTRRKQGLHDLLASTRVVSARPGGVWLAAALSLTAAGLVGAAVYAAVDAYQGAMYRRRSTEAYAALTRLAAVEYAQLEQTGDYAPFSAPAVGKPGVQRRAWSKAELDAAAAIGLEVPAAHATYFSYRLVVGRTDDGQPTWAACAEADLDGDGVVQAYVMFQPAQDAAGAEVAPPAPCAHGPRLARPLTFQGETRPLKASPSDVY